MLMAAFVARSYQGERKTPNTTIPTVKMTSAIEYGREIGNGFRSSSSFSARYK
jgi:hypothetical protein